MGDRGCRPQQLTTPGLQWGRATNATGKIAARQVPSGFVLVQDRCRPVSVTAQPVRHSQEEDAIWSSDPGSGKTPRWGQKPSASPRAFS